jgi:hypothetical protein
LGMFSVYFWEHPFPDLQVEIRTFLGWMGVRNELYGMRTFVRIRT